MTNSDINIDEFGALAVYDDSGQAVKLSSLWKKKPCSACLSAPFWMTDLPSAGR